MALCAPRTVALLRSTLQAPAQDPARALNALESTKQERLRGRALTQTMCITVSCAPPMAPSLRSTCRARAQAPARAPCPQISTRRERFQDRTWTQAMLVMAFYARRTAPLLPRSMFRARAQAPAKAPSLIATTHVKRDHQSTFRLERYVAWLPAAPAPAGSAASTHAATQALSLPVAYDNGSELGEGH